MVIGSFFRVFYPSRPPLKGRSPLLAVSCSNFLSPWSFSFLERSQGVRQMIFYFFDHIIYIIINLLIGKTNDRDTHVFKLRRAVNVMFLYF